MSGSVDARTRPHVEAAYQTLVQRALTGECFACPADLAGLARTDHSQPLTAAERAESQR